MALVALRSAQWYSGDVRNAYIHRAWMRRGTPDDAFGRPQIAIANTASDLVPCNRHLTEVAASVRDGVLTAGGAPPGAAGLGGGGGGGRPGAPPPAHPPG